MSPSLSIRLIPLALGILSAVIHWFVPRLTRPDLYFAVTVAPGFRDGPEGRAVLRLYRLRLIGVSILALTLMGALGLTSAFALAPLALLAQIGSNFGVFYGARRQVLPHRLAPTTIREAEVGPRDRRIPGGWMSAAVPFALLAASAAYLGMHWQQIPERLVLHWGIHGQPDRWAARSLGTVFLPIFIAAVTLLAMTLLLYGMAHWLRPIHSSGPEGAQEARYRRIASIMILALEYWVAVLCSWLSIRPLLPASLQRPPAAIALVPAVIAVAVTAILMWLGQGGSRIRSLQRPEPQASQPVGDRTEDRFWKLGVFYFNRDDPSIMVEKRFGIGYTMNFAHPLAWIILGLLALVPLAVTTTIAIRHMMR